MEVKQRLGPNYQFQKLPKHGILDRSSSLCIDTYRMVSTKSVFYQKIVFHYKRYKINEILLFVEFFELDLWYLPLKLAENPKVVLLTRPIVIKYKNTDYVFWHEF